jgi:serine/threonine-protein kinase
VQGGSGYLTPVPSPVLPPPPLAPDEPRSAAPPVAQSPVADVQKPAPGRPLVPVLVSVVAIALIGAAAVFLAQRSSATPGHGEAAVVALPQSTIEQLPTTAPPTTTTEPITTEPITTEPAAPTDEASAQAALQAQTTTDQPAVEQLNGSWVSELSAKKPGTLANGSTYDYQSIWADYQQQVAAHPGALLLRSDTFSTFTYGGFWVIVMPTTYTAAAPANAWCDSQNIDPDDCYAKRLSHTGSPRGSSVLRH